MSEDSAGLRLLLIALATVILFHGGLLPFTHGNTYDAFIHMFFADSYHRSWFDTWEPRWYTGFATTSYPPGTHMAIGGLMHVMPLRAAFVVVQLLGLILLTVGVYRFSRLWVTPRPAGYAALALALSSSISETVHLFGQLPTIFSLGVFLNGLPYVYRWIVEGGLDNLLAAIIFSAATTAAHHVTSIFGGVLFIVPLAVQSLRAVGDLVPRGPGRFAGIRRLGRPFGRGLILAVLMLSAIVMTVLPYWIWSISDPITQVPIPHGSRENFLERTDLGFIFFVLPWGVLILFLPYVLYKTLTSRLWPLGLSVLLCFVLGTGGTTPISRAILGGAFDILTLDRFTFWATILILPFVGHMLDGLLHGRSGQVLVQAFGRPIQRLLVGGLFLSMTLIAVFAAILPVMQRTQPDFIDPTPIVRFLEEDDHDRWRYLTLGFGDQFAYLSAQTTAQSIDGNYHSARRLPDMTRFSVERLENAKYLGVPGLGSLRQFLVNAENYHLRYVFSNDAFYDPLLHFVGWTRLTRLQNGVTIWERKDISPLPVFQPRRTMPPTQMVMWGVLPPLMLILAGLILLITALRQGFISQPSDVGPMISRTDRFARPGLVRFIVLIVGLIFVTGWAIFGWKLWTEMKRPQTPEAVIEAYFDDLDFREFGSAYDRLDPVTRPAIEDVMFNWRWRGGLIASYGKLTDIRTYPIRVSSNLIDWRVELDWLTSLDLRQEVIEVRTVLRDGKWHVAPTALRPIQTPARLQRETTVAWNTVGRRQPLPETDAHRDRLDRPRLNITGARLVERGGRYSIVGEVTNTDADPAFVSLFSNLVADDQVFALQSGAETIPQRMLPAETSGFRIDVEGVLSLEDEEAAGGFDPTMFIPPELPQRPTGAKLEARAIVSGLDMYRGVTLNGLTVTPSESGPMVSANAVNTGTETATLIRVLVVLFDDGNQPIWAEAGYVESNIYPGQNAPISFALPNRDEIRVVSGIDGEDIIVNGSTPDPGFASPDSNVATIRLDGIPGYSAMRVHLSTMTYDPLL